MRSLQSCPIFATLWAVAHQAPLSLGFSRQECWSGSPFPSPGDLPHPGIELGSPAWQADSLPSAPPGKTVPDLRLCVCIYRGPASISGNTALWEARSRLSGSAFPPPLSGGGYVLYKPRSKGSRAPSQARRANSHVQICSVKEEPCSPDCEVWQEGTKAPSVREKKRYRPQIRASEQWT